MRRFEKEAGGYPKGRSAGKGLIDMSSNFNDHPVRGVGLQGQGARSGGARRKTGMIWSELHGDMKRRGQTRIRRNTLQNLPKKEGIRGIYIPPPGYAFFACDYNQIELASLSQHCLNKYGHSILAEKINAGVDCHRWLAAQAYNKKTEDVTKEERSFAKVANFGSL